ncbi:hypothetical protein [Streptomyces pacificus]|uniref:Uncharacterized protein n=1 Tax=Streptomyces pacificus TaxID=2705029 RepID=A0A6A0ASR7_9ACTN|nr:hypothetical protein SCWH03_11180 [Streptomyces pacificus]
MFVVVLGPRLASVRAFQRCHAAVLVIGGTADVAQRIRPRQQAVVAAVIEASDRPQCVDLGNDLGALVDHEALRVAVTIGGGSRAQAGSRVRVVPGEAGFDVAVGAGLVGTAVLVVVDVFAVAAVGVRPRGDAAVLVAAEAQGPARRVDDLGEVPVGVAVAQDLLIGSVRSNPREVQGGHASFAAGDTLQGAATRGKVGAMVYPTGPETRERLREPAGGPAREAVPV